LTFFVFFSNILFGTFNPTFNKSWENLLFVKKRRIKYMMKNSYMQKKETVKRDWYVIDAEGVSLGRLATRVADVLRGKHKPTYTTNIDCGDFVVVVNASKVNLTGNKLNDKIYYNHSGYTGGLRERTAKEMRENYPVEMIERAVKGMLPHNRLGRQMYKKLFVYKGATHKHEAQKPVALEVK
jgi:large subunit ribosomal protein L13